MAIPLDKTGIKRSQMAKGFISGNAAIRETKAQGFGFYKMLQVSHFLKA